MNRLPAYLFTPDREDEFEPPVTEREPACDDDCRRCIVCQALCDEGDTCSPECESEYRTGIREQARDAAREQFTAVINDVVRS